MVTTGAKASTAKLRIRRMLISRLLWLQDNPDARNINRRYESVNKVFWRLAAFRSGIAALFMRF
jgi:hypothetical protein